MLFAGWPAGGFLFFLKEAQRCARRRRVRIVSFNGRLKHLSFDALARWQVLFVCQGEESKAFVATGSPAVFVQRAQALILQRRDIPARRPEGVIKLTDHPFSWTPWRRPSIKLKGPDLVFRMSGVLAVVQTQIAFIDLLCDLEEWTEEMHRDLSVGTRTPADHTERGG